jgi:hypothetical protein
MNDAVLGSAHELRLGGAEASVASVWLPEAIASSTLRTNVRMRLRRERLIAVRFAIWRVIFLADTVLAMGASSSLAIGRLSADARAYDRMSAMETEEPATGAGSRAAAYKVSGRKGQRALQRA